MFLDLKAPIVSTICCIAFSFITVYNEGFLPVLWESYQFSSYIIWFTRVDIAVNVPLPLVLIISTIAPDGPPAFNYKGYQKFSVCKKI